jgi:hypothetical protein
MKRAAMRRSILPPTTAGTGDVLIAGMGAGGDRTQFIGAAPVRAHCVARLPRKAPTEPPPRLPKQRPDKSSIEEQVRQSNHG